MIDIKKSVNFPAPINLNYFWNFGSILVLILLIQVISGIFLSLNYSSNSLLSFDSVINIMKNINEGFYIRLFHIIGSSLFFLFIYLHLLKGLYYYSFKKEYVWMVGVVILLISMMISFIGYVLPWGQMSLWGATVITNLITAIPYIGIKIVYWIWGGFSVGPSTLSRFFSFHFLFTFLLILLIIIHILLLHNVGSNNSLGINIIYNKKNFHPYYLIKDILGFFLLFIIFFTLILFYPYLISDPENFIPANSLVTPVHIMPEWYFLFAYAILRCIPNKLGGVLGLLLSILILFTLILNKNSKINKLKFFPILNFFFYFFLINFILLFFMGYKVVDFPYNLISIISTIYYFFNYVLIVPVSNYIFS